MTKKEITEIRDKLRTVHSTVTAERRELRLKLEALGSPEARRALTPEHRTKRTIEERTASRKRVQDEAVSTIARARATLARREQLVGVEAVLRGATFANELPPKDWSNVLPAYKFGGDLYDADKEAEREGRRLMISELRLLREQNTRLRWHAELKQYTPAELADLVTGCTASADLALLSMARREIQSRPHNDALVPARVAVTAALQAIEAPKAVRELTEMFGEVASLEAELTNAYGEIVSGRINDTDEKVAAVREATKLLGPIEGPQMYVTDRIRAREQRKGQVADAVKAEAKAIEAPPPPAAA
jgi:hypothetical protein